MHENFRGIIKPNSAEFRLLSSIDPEKLPKHMAIIMDGNGRWAKMRGKPRIFGHRAGAESVKSIVDTSARLGIPAVTLYAFSTENWKRPRREVTGLMTMLKRFLRSELETVRRNNIRFQAIGNIEGLSEDVQKEIRYAMDATKSGTAMVLSVALNYGGRAEIVEACRKIAAKALSREIKPDEIDEAAFENQLYTCGLPSVDLLIRTSGEMRISNFLLWQIAYAEIYVTPVLFPDFRRRDIFEAIIEFQKRERRFGDIKSKN
ncbi:MAG TPA: isoprenyl transferase [Pyrinomonadaceae bacterium]|jgi:undecaprenyl diphosphate synthase|nr:isoprenyl transferase [Pyrinomonadaceae bacterium]